MYSAVDRLLWARDVLDGTPKMSTLLGSCFGGLFQIHVCRIYSGKVVHNMMTRQLNVMYMYTVMSTFRLVAITQSCTPQHVHPYIMYNV
ncbi:unnamed protein product [Brassica oleracea var. botrytis]